jgi:uncharacterized protein (TIGR02118 family)
MYKVAWIARFPKGMAKEDARRHWAETHGPMCVKVPGIEQYVQNHVVGPLPMVSGVAEEETYFDGYSCGWWADKSAYEGSMETPEWQALVEDGDNVFDMEWLWGMSAQVEERPIIQGPSSPYKVVWIVRFKPGMDRDEAREYWTNVHGQIFLETGIDRYVQNHVVAPLAEGIQLGFDGFSECWFKDEAQFLQAINTPAWADAVVDGENLFDMSQLWGAVLQERVVKAAKELAAA